MKLNLLFFIIFYFSISLFSQENTKNDSINDFRIVTGFVYDCENKPLNGISVIENKSSPNKFSNSDSTGFFKIKVNKNSKILFFDFGSITEKKQFYQFRIIEINEKNSFPFDFQNEDEISISEPIVLEKSNPKINKGKALVYLNYKKLSKKELKRIYYSSHIEFDSLQLLIIDSQTAVKEVGSKGENGVIFFIDNHRISLFKNLIANIKIKKYQNYFIFYFTTDRLKFKK